MGYNDPNQSGFYTKPLTPMELYYLGIPSENLNTLDTLEELKLTPPNIVIAQCIDSAGFIQNRSRQQNLKKKDKYVMGLGIYMQLHYDTKQGRQILKPSTLQFKNMYKIYNGEDLSNKKLLVFRTGGIGDLLFIQPNLIYLKEKYPSCKIIFACGPQYHSMVKEWGCVDEVLDLPFNASYLLRTDYHVFFEGVIERCKQAETINAYNLFSKWMGLDLPDELLVPKQIANPVKVEECKQILKGFGLENKQFIIAQIRSSSPIRTPNPKMWETIFNDLTSKGYNIVITDSQHANRVIDRFIVSNMKDKEKVFNFSQYSKEIGDSIALTSLANLALGVDSSLNHIAVSLGVKTMGIFGPFPSNVRFSTYPKNLCDSIECERICAPCFLHGTQNCDQVLGKGFVPCYDTLDTNKIVEKIERLINV